MKRVLIGKRGLTGLAPENTLPAFSFCKKNLLNWFQCDIRILKDGTIIAYSSNDLDRCGTYCKDILDLKREDLEKIDVGSWFSDKFIGEKIPTLEEIIDLLNENELNIIMELKEIENENEFISQLKNNISTLEKRRKLIISGEDFKFLKKIKENIDEVEIAVIFKENLDSDSMIKILEECKASHIQLEDKITTREKVIYFKNKDYKIEILNVNELIRGNQLFNWGVNGIVTEIAEKFPNNYKK